MRKLIAFVGLLGVIYALALQHGVFNRTTAPALPEAQAQSSQQWFRVKVPGKTFMPGQKYSGQVAYPGYEHIAFEVTIEKAEPERLLSWRWHPAAIDPKVDYSSEPTTLVEFQLQDAVGGTLLTVVETGIDKIPVPRRLEVFRMNSEGWDGQMENIQKHVATS